ncbi:MAG TPA: LamG-like jellyroll fold domain-containing protein, partial [Gemmataceae bacterium]|nr:LamG-like jellyroll fold domain-containing protein [Gemmataceae bacterium]
ASGGDDLIDVSKTTGFLVMSATGHSVVNVGDDLNSLDNIQGAIAVGPSGGSAVTLNLNDQAATTPQRLDISASILGTSFQRSGAANIQVIGNPLDTFNWTSGSGGTTINMYVRPPAQTVNFNLGNDVLNIGSKTHTISDFGALTVTGGIGPDGLVLNDSGETRPQTYTVSQADGRETIATRGTTIDLGPDLEQVTLKGGSGGNTFNVEGTVAGLTTILFAGTGSDAVAVGDTDNRLQGIQGPVTLNGQGGVDQLTFNDQGTDTVENYTLAADLLRRVEATGFFEDMAPISFASFKAITLNMSGAASAASTAAVVGSVANTTVTVNGSAGSPNDFAVDASANAIKGPVVFNGQPADGDFAQYYDIGNTAPHTYTLTSTGVKRDGQAQVFSNVGAIVYASMVGGNTVNVSSVALGGSFKIQAASGDQVTVGSKAPRLGGTLTNILDQVNVVSYTANDAVTVVFDDSGNVDTTAKHVTFSGFDADGNVSMLGLTSIAQSWNLPATSSVKVLGGAADEIFSLRSAVTATPLFINGGGGVNTLDYSGYDVTASIPGLISWYKGEGDATDAVSANNGTPTNGATFAQGQVGQAFSLDGVDDFIEIPDSPNQTPSSLTLEAWVNPVSVIGLRSILSKYQSSDPGPDNVSWFLGSIDGRIQFGVYQSGLGRVIETDNPVLVEGSWQHVAGTFDVATQTIKIYLNGVEIPSSFVAGHDHTVTGIGDSNSPVRIGTLSNSDGVLNGFWSGLVDEASIYDRALSDSDIQSIVAAGSAGKSAQPATDVTVNLQLGTATGIAGGIANIQNVIGGNGNDTLIAGAGRSILIGGGGADNLIGGSGQAILISGTTDFTQPALDIAALDVVFQEWNRTDLGFEDRMSDLLTGSNSQGVAAKNVVAGMEILLNSNTVHDDLFADSLAGGTGRDWFFNGPGDVISNIKAGDVVT